MAKKVKVQRSKGESEVAPLQEEPVGVQVKSTPSALALVTSHLKKARKGVLDHFVPLSKSSINEVHPHISTSNIQFDYLLGGEFNSQGLNNCPGVPRGKITNIFGAEHCGKTSFALHVAATVCAQGGTVLYIDYENVLDVRYASKLGIPVYDENRFGLFQPETLEQGMAALIVSAHHGVDLIVIDSVGAAVPRKIYDLSVEEIAKGEAQAIGLQARVWGQFIPTITRHLKNGNTALIAIAQTRSAISSKTPEVQGGKSWKFYSAVRMEFKYTGGIDGMRYDALSHSSVKSKTGSKVIATVRKNKIASTTFWTTELECIPNQGFDPLHSVVNVAISRGVVIQAGTWLTWDRQDGSQIRAQGKTKFLSLVREAPNTYQELYDRVRPLLGTQSPGDSSSSEGEEDFSSEVPSSKKALDMDKVMDIADGKAYE